jgi:hypothetical protein
MKLNAFCDKNDLELELRRFANQKGRWLAKITGGEFKTTEGSSILQGIYGSGTTPNEAIKDFVRQIKGMHMVVYACTSRRFELPIPKNLTV